MTSHRRLSPVFLIALAALLLGSLVPLAGVSGQDGSPPSAQEAASPDDATNRPVPALTYQGNLNRSGAPYTGVCDFKFSLWPNESGGLQIGLTRNSTGVQVTNGMFTTLLVFGFDNDFIIGGENRFIQTEVKCAGDSDFTRLSPRQALRPTASALTLQPGARIIDRSLTTGVDALSVTQTIMNSNAIHGKGTATGSIGVWGEGVNNTGVYGSSQGGTGVWGQSTNANTVAVKGIANATGSVGVWGESTANTGVYGQSGAAGGAALWGRNTAGGIALKAEGNAVQSLNMNGLPKAIVSIGYSGYDIVRCYNGITGATTNGCGFTASYVKQGTNGDNSISTINFGFNVGDRFIVATPLNPMGIDVQWAFHLRNVSGNQATFQNWRCFDGGNCNDPFTGNVRVPIPFYVVVY